MGELTGHPVGFPGGTSVVFTTPFPIQPGMRARDTLGNEYIFCDFTGTVSPKQPVAITITAAGGATAEPLSTTGRGAMGVCCATGTSDQAGWVQIYGNCMMQIVDGNSGGSQPSPSDAANGPTTLQTSARTVFTLASSLTSPHALAWVTGNTSTTSGIFVEGLFVARDASPGDVSVVTATTVGDRHTGAQIRVELNYPTLVQRNYGE